jgi:hypothetical protein
VHPLPFLTGPCLIGLGLALRYLIGKRRFNRRNQAGMELFPSYGAAVVTRLTESLGRIIGALLILVGVVVLLARTLKP